MSEIISMHSVYTKSLNRVQRREHWQRIIADWRRSGLKRRVFCDKHQIKVADLKRWDYRLNQINHKPLLSHSQPDNACEKINPTVSFVPVEIASPAHPNPAGLLQLQHQSGFSMNINTQTDEQLIKKVIRLFTEARC